MLPIQLALLKAITTSALSLQLSQPIVPAELNSGANFARPNGPQTTVNTSMISESSGNLSRQWDGTIAVALNETNILISLPSSTDLSQRWNDTLISTPSISTEARHPISLLHLPPWPKGWKYQCNQLLGTNMNPSSCLDAWTFLPPIERKVTFGPRSSGNIYDVGLPRRYLSCTFIGMPKSLLLSCDGFDTMLTTLQS